MGKSQTAKQIKASTLYCISANRTTENRRWIIYKQKGDVRQKSNNSGIWVNEF